MAATQGILSMQVMHSRTLDSTLQAFFPAEDKKTPPTSQLEQDLLELSPFSQVRGLIESFRSSSAVGASMTIDLTTPLASGDDVGQTDSLIDRDLDLMLRMLAEDDDDYQRLRGRFEDMLRMARGGSDQAGAQPQASSRVQTGSSSAARALEAHVASETTTLQQQFQSVQVTVRKEEEKQVDIMAVRIQEADPLVLDLDGSGVQLTKAGEGAVFDINADGRLDQTAWVKGNTAFLALDRNENGTIDNGKELFGEQHGAADGLQELAKFDADKDNRITRTDPVFKALQLYRDLNGNGKIDVGEMSKLQDHGIESINLHFLRDNAKINGNSLLLKTTFERANGTTGSVADVMLGFRAIP